MAKTFKEYKETYNHAPYSLTECAEGALDLEDNHALKSRARNFLDEKELFELTLSDYDIEMG